MAATSNQRAAIEHAKSGSHPFFMSSSLRRAIMAMMHVHGFAHANMNPVVRFEEITLCYHCFSAVVEIVAQLGTM